MRALILPGGFRGPDDAGVAMWDLPPLLTLPRAGRSMLARAVASMADIGIDQTLILADRHPHALRAALADLPPEQWRVLYPGPDEAARSLSRVHPLIDEGLLILDGQAWFPPGMLARVLAASETSDAARLSCLKTGRSALLLRSAALSLLSSHTAESLDEHLKAACRQTSGLNVLEFWSEAEDRASASFLLPCPDEACPPGEGYEQARPGVWVHQTARVPSEVLDRARGPIHIGRDARVAHGVTLIGPVELADETTVGTGSTLESAYIAPNTAVGARLELKSKVARQSLLQDTCSGYTVRIEEPEMLQAWHPQPLAQRMRDGIVRLAESTAAGISLVVLAPLLLVAAAMVRLSSPGPLLYQSRRTVRPPRLAERADAYLNDDGETIPYPVFRTMYCGADQIAEDARGENLYQSGPFRKFRHDCRITPLGHLLRKTSIDELPLLWWVLRGKLSLVGVWALPGEEAGRLARSDMPIAGRRFEEIARMRFGSRPGLAGLWQCQGRSALSAEQRALYDSYQAVVTGPRPLPGEYRRYGSLNGRLQLLLRTVFGVLSRKGAL